MLEGDSLGGHLQNLRPAFRWHQVYSIGEYPIILLRAINHPTGNVSVLLLGWLPCQRFQILAGVHHTAIVLAGCPSVNPKNQVQSEKAFSHIPFLSQVLKTQSPAASPTITPFQQILYSIPSYSCFVHFLHHAPSLHHVFLTVNHPMFNSFCPWKCWDLLIGCFPISGYVPSWKSWKRCATLRYIVQCDSWQP